MEDITLHGTSPPAEQTRRPNEMGQYTYDDEMFSPRWRALRDYGVHSLESHLPGPETREPTRRSSAVSHRLLEGLVVIGVFVFLCSTASLAIVAMLLDSSNAYFQQVSDMRMSLDSIVRVGQALLARDEDRAENLYKLQINYTRLEKAFSMLSTFIKQG